MRDKNRLFGHHSEMVQRLIFFFQKYEICFFIAHTYMVQMSLQNSGGKWFFRGVPWNPPWAPMGVKVPWSFKC